MSPVTAILGPEHTLRQAAERMIANKTGAAVVVDPSLPGPAVITERDLLRAIGEGGDPEQERVADHLTAELVTAWPDWPIERAARLMLRHNIRHVLAFDGTGLVGILSMRDILRVGALVPAADVAAAPPAEAPARSQETASV
jgi:CBS domain-containing protein